jgi:excisionase family DNA binding protein
MATNLKQNETTMQSDVWWDIRKSARHCDVSVAFLRKAVRLKMVPFSRVGTKLLRFRRSELDKWLESNGTGGEITYRKS